MRLHAFLLVILALSDVHAQNPDYVREMIDTLCAPRYHGRGYVSDGDLKAARFLVRECQKSGLQPVGEDFLQSFKLGVNTFPGSMDVSLNGRRLLAGEDFIIHPGSQDVHGEYKTLRFKSKWGNNREKLFELATKKKVNERVIVVDATDESNGMQNFVSLVAENPLKAQGYIVRTDQKLTWSVSRRMLNTTVLEVKDEAAPGRIRKVELAIDQEWQSEHVANNVIASIPGESDSMIVFTAHYDHLGRMGSDTYIAGASDNASGSAMLLDLAAYYLKHPQRHTIVFIWFAAEEAGLVGSRYFVDHPRFPLENISFLINLDLMADAGEGVTVVNGKIYTDKFETLVAINEENTLLNTVKARGAAANSDHYPFYEKGVPGFFIYTMGDYKHYHDIHDVPENIPLTNYAKVFELITRFVDREF